MWQRQLIRTHRRDACATTASPKAGLLGQGDGVSFEAMNSWLSERISFDPAVCHGKPVVRGTRVLVANVVGAVAAGQSTSAILQDYPSLKADDISACLEFAGHLAAMETIEV